MFAYLKWHGQGLFRNLYFFIFWTFFISKHFYFTIQLDFTKKSITFLQIFFQILKVEHKSFFNDVSFVIFGHKTWDLEVFKYPSVYLFIFLSYSPYLFDYLKIYPSIYISLSSFSININNKETQYTEYLV